MWNVVYVSIAHSSFFEAVNVFGSHDQLQHSVCNLWWKFCSQEHCSPNMSGAALFCSYVYVRFYDFRYCWQGTYCSQYRTSYTTARLTEFYVVFLRTVAYTTKLHAAINYILLRHSEDRASWYILIIKPTRSTNFSNLFLEWDCTCFGQYLRPSSGV